MMNDTDRKRARLLNDVHDKIEERLRRHISTLERDLESYRKLLDGVVYSREELSSATGDGKLSIGSRVEFDTLAWVRVGVNRKQKKVRLYGIVEDVKSSPGEGVKVRVKPSEESVRGANRKHQAWIEDRARWLKPERILKSSEVGR